MKIVDTTIGPPYKKSDGKTITLPELAKKFYLRHDGDLSNATNELLEFFNENPKLLRTIIQDDLVNIARRAILAVQREVRSEIWARPRPVAPEVDQQRVRGLADGSRKIIERRLMEMPLRSGIRVGDADGEQILEDQLWYHTQGRNLLDKSRWFQLIYDALSVKSGKPVRQQLSESDLEDFQAKVEHS